MESKTSVSEDREIKLSTRQNTAEHTGLKKRNAHSLHYLALYNYYAPVRAHKYTRPKMQDHINSNGIDVVINMLISQSLCFGLLERKSLSSYVILSSDHTNNNARVPRRKHRYIQITYTTTAHRKMKWVNQTATISPFTHILYIHTQGHEQPHNLYERDEALSLFIRRSTLINTS